MYNGTLERFWCTYVSSCTADSARRRTKMARRRFIGLRNSYSPSLPSHQKPPLQFLLILLLRLNHLFSLLLNVASRPLCCGKEVEYTAHLLCAWFFERKGHVQGTCRVSNYHSFSPRMLNRREITHEWIKWAFGVVPWTPFIIRIRNVVVSYMNTTWFGMRN